MQVTVDGLAEGLVHEVALVDRLADIVQLIFEVFVRYSSVGFEILVEFVDSMLRRQCQGRGSRNHVAGVVDSWQCIQEDPVLMIGVSAEAIFIILHSLAHTERLVWNVAVKLAEIENNFSRKLPMKADT